MNEKRGVIRQNKQLVKNATYASIGMACILIGLKYFAWSMTGSISLLSTLLDSFLDLSASVLNFFAVRHAMRPPTENYTFGHGKAEALSALAQAAFIMGSALFFILEVYERFFYPEDIQETGIGIAVMALSIALTIFLVGYQRRIIRKTKSLAIYADSLHYFSDVLINGCVIISLTGTWYFGWEWLDPISGLCIAFYVVYMAVKITIRPLQVLMDRELCEEDRKKIVSIIMKHKEIKGFHELRTRSAGQSVFIQMHLELDKKLSLQRAHEIADEVMKAIEKVFPGAEVLIHQDPV